MSFGYLNCLYADIQISIGLIYKHYMDQSLKSCSLL